MKYMTIFAAQDLSRLEDVIDALALLSYQLENMDDPADMRRGSRMCETVTIIDCTTCGYAYPVYNKEGYLIGCECNVNNLVFIPCGTPHSCGRWTEVDE